MSFGDWHNKVVDEAHELKNKVSTLEIFIWHDPTFATLTPKHRKLLQLQHTVMSQYLEILHKRLIDE